jgi:rhamnosyltransferase subunit B
MKFALVAYGTHGDVYPFLAVGRELIQRGHDVVLATLPQYKETVLSLGLTFSPLCSGHLLDNFTRSHSSWDVARGANSFFSDLIIPFVDPVFRFVNSQDLNNTCILASVLAIGARIAREMSPFRLVTLCPYPVFFPSRERPPALPRINLAALGETWWSRLLFRMLGGLDRFVLGAPQNNPRSYVGLKRSAFRRHLFTEAYVRLSDLHIARALNRYRRGLGLQERTRYFENYLFSPDLVVGLFPDWFAPRQADWPQNAVLSCFPDLDRPHLAPSEAFRRFVGTVEAPPILFTFGSQKRGNRDLFELAAQACAELGHPAIFLSQNPDDILPGLSPRMIHLEFEPLPDILPHIKLIVHHAGIGTSADALRAGVPQILLPFCYDQPDNATRLQRLGVGRLLSAGSLTVEGLKAEIRHVLDTPLYQERTRHYAQAMADTGRAFPASQAVLKWLGQTSPPQARRAMG